MSLASFAVSQLLRVLPREQISRIVGQLCEQPLPAVVSSVVSRAYGLAFRVDMSEAAAPHGAYGSFDAFFTRPLREGLRPIASTAVVSPSDGRLSAFGPIDAAARIFVKGQHYEVAELLGDVQQAQRMVGGSYAVIYLSPRDYHRVHSPVDGQLVSVRGIAGDWYPVNALGERFVPQLFAKNRRVAVTLTGSATSEVSLVFVGALIVGKISVHVLGNDDVTAGDHPINPPVSVRRGDEVGAFHLGSTAVVFLPPGFEVVRSIGPIRLGDALASGPAVPAEGS